MYYKKYIDISSIKRGSTEAMICRWEVIGLHVATDAVPTIDQGAGR